MTLCDQRFKWIRTTRKLTCAQKGLLCILLHYLGDKQECWPANSTLAEDANLNEKSVMRHLRYFQESGLLTVSYGKRPRGGTTGRILHFHFPGEQDGDLRTETEDKIPPAADKNAPSPEKTPDIPAPRSCHSVPSEQDILSLPGGTKCPAEKVLEFKKSKGKKNLGLDFKKRQVGIPRKRSAPASTEPNPDPLTAPEDPPVDEGLIRTILELYGQLCTGMIPAEKFTAKRQEALKTLCEKVPDARKPEWWQTYLERASRITLFTGGSKRGWRADLDWLLLPWTVSQIRNGHYDDHMRPPVEKPEPCKRGAQPKPERSPIMNTRKKARRDTSPAIGRALRSPERAGGAGR